MKIYQRKRVWLSNVCWWSLPGIDWDYFTIILYVNITIIIIIISFIHLQQQILNLYQLCIYQNWYRYHTFWSGLMQLITFSCLFNLTLLTPSPIQQRGWIPAAVAPSALLHSQMFTFVKLYIFIFWITFYVEAKGKTAFQCYFLVSPISCTYVLYFEIFLTCIYHTWFRNWK